jgi:hypothetical protein
VFIILHKLLVCLAATSMMIGVGAAVFFRRSRYWLKIHQYFNSLAGILLSAGVLMAAVMITGNQGEHLHGNHPVAGGITLILTAFTLILGFYQFRAGIHLQKVRTLHRWLGRLTLLSLVITLILGLVHAGII